MVAMGLVVLLALFLLALFLLALSVVSRTAPRLLPFLSCGLFPACGLGGIDHPNPIVARAREPW